MSDQVKNKKQDAKASKSPAPEPVTPAVTSDEKLEGSQPLTPELIASYQDSHYRLLLLLSLLLAFLLACFPISDPEIFFSFETGKMVSLGEFPWGSDPYGFADGDHAPWTHTGWLGDLTIYGLYLAGGGPLLVFVRALLLVFLFWLLLRIGTVRTPHLGTVFVVLLGIVTISHRLYFRTELFSLVLLGITFWALANQPPANCWFSRFHQLTGGRCYWLLPLLFVVWVNVDSWFFLGLGVVALWCLGSWLKSNEGNINQLRSLTIITLLCVAACLCNPFHVKAFLQIPALLVSPTATELDARFVEQKQQNAKTRMTEHQRLFLSPWSGEFFQIQRGDAIANLTSQAPFLPSFYPMGMSISEWAYYPLLILVLFALIVKYQSWSWGNALILLVLAALSCWQSRLIGFFAVGGVALGVGLFQSQPRVLPSMNRLMIVGGQLLCLLIGLFIQIISLLHLIPTPDYSPSALGYIHPRGSFGFSFRSDASISQACEVLDQWHKSNQLAGKPFHIDWIDVPAYDVWFNQGSRHFFDTRQAVHSEATTKAFFDAREALLGVITDPAKDDGSNLSTVFERQAKWQRIFKSYDISYIIVKRRAQQKLELVRALLLERDKNQQPLWKPLQLHNGQVYALAWVGSPHWEQLKKLQFNPGEMIFRQQRPIINLKGKSWGRESLSKYLTADPPRRPAALDEADWYAFEGPAELYVRGEKYNEPLPIPTRLEIYGGHQMLLSIGSVGARLAAPLNQLPTFPLWFTGRQSSASTLYLSLEAARRGFADLPPDVPAYYRSEICLKYFDAATALSAYEQAFSPAAFSFREPQLQFLLRQAAYAALDAGQPAAIDLNLKLASNYVNNGALDAALEHYLLVTLFIERLQPEKAEANIKIISASCKQKFGFSPDELQNEVKRRIDAWEKQVAQSSWASQGDEAGKNVLNRAKLALQLGLPKKALDEILTAGVKSIEVTQMVCQIYTIFGQYDLVWQGFIQKSPALQASLQPIQLHSLGALGEWCLGRPDLAAPHRLAVAKLMDQSSLKSAIYGGQFMLMGTTARGISNVLEGNGLVQDAMKMSFDIADQKIQTGLLLLEAGQPQQAAALFSEALNNIEPSSPWRPLLQRYYLQITGEVLK